MNVTIFAGKGGVGKSTSAVAYALQKAKKSRNLIIDYDGGHSIPTVLSLENKNHKSNKIILTKIKNINIALIDLIKFQPIKEIKKQKKSIEEYLSQFKADYGIVPFCDMITSFFGAPTDITSVSCFASLIDVYHKAKRQKIDNIVIDVEPTAGLERLLNSTESITKSMKNLQKIGLIALTAVGTVWPDIKTYLKGDYIKNAEIYAKRLNDTAKALENANYFLVCNPEKSPVDEMQEVKGIISNYNGKIIGYIINNIRGESYEKKQIQRVNKQADNLPIIEIKHDLRLCDSNSKSRLIALKEAGALFQ